MTRLFLFSIFGLLLISCANSQNKNQDHFKLVGGPCEGCEAIFEYGDRALGPVDTLPGFNDQGFRLKVTGTVYQNDGKTPAKDIILYVYQTNEQGIYATKGTETGWAKRHGYIRGWLKTGSDGRYSFYTLKPGIYPSRSEAAHIHLTILEPDGKYYWVESYLFAEDSLLSNKQRHKPNPRGGSTGLLTLQKTGHYWEGRRDIILGENIPNYE